MKQSGSIRCYIIVVGSNLHTWLWVYVSPSSHFVSIFWVAADYRRPSKTEVTFMIYDRLQFFVGSILFSGVRKHTELIILWSKSSDSNKQAWQA